MPKIRHISSWLLRHPDELDTDEQLALKQVLATCPHLEATATQQEQRPAGVTVDRVSEQ